MKFVQFHGVKLKELFSIFRHRHLIRKSWSWLMKNSKSTGLSMKPGRFMTQQEIGLLMSMVVLTKISGMTQR